GLMADANGDDVVDAADLEIWRENFGRAPIGLGPAPVPEPAAAFAVLTVAVAASTLGRRRAAPAA
ncbi:MAG: PEP-CTERM sorting domain-containing protein, partial [Planctomycetota bacterium]